MEREEKVSGKYFQSRLNMVQCQLQPNGVMSSPLLEAFKNIPREYFVPPHMQTIAYQDNAIRLSKERYLLSPLVLGKLFQDADVYPTSKILVVGFTTGYSLAITRRLSNTVYGLENDNSWIEEAQNCLARLSLSGINFCVASLKDGHPTERNFDIILIEGAIPFIPHQLLEALTPQGRLVCILKEQGIGRGVILRKDKTSSSTHYDAQVPLLPDFDHPKEFNL